MAKLADAQDLKSWVPQGTCGFDPHPRHQLSDRTRSVYAQTENEPDPHRTARIRLKSSYSSTHHADCCFLVVSQFELADAHSLGLLA